MATHGKVCDFSFYVIAFDTKKHFAKVGTPAKNLSLEQAKAEFAKRCSENPIIERHNMLEDKGLAAEDQWDL